MSEVIAVLVGVALSLVVTPVIERRVRARERWERDVPAFGELLSQDVRLARNAVWSAWLSWEVLHDVADSGVIDRTTEKFAEEEKDRLEAARPLVKQLDDLVNVRAQWLMLRVARSAPTVIERRWQIYRVFGHDLTSAYGWTPDRRKLVAEAMDREESERKKLMTEIESLAAKIGPGQPLRARAARMWRTIRHRVAKRRDTLLARFKRSK